MSIFEKGDTMDSFNVTKNNKLSFTRRGFLGVSASIGSLVLSGKSSLAETIPSAYRPLSVEELHGWGEEPGIAGIGNNENPFGPSPRALRAINNSVMDINRYDFGAYTKLEIAIGEHLGLEREAPPSAGGRGLFRDSGYPIYVEGGSSFILNQITAIYGVKDGVGEIIEIDPGYAGVSRAALGLRSRFGMEITVKRVPTTHEFKHDLNGMLNAVSDNTTLIVITNPNNPTGTILSYQEIKEFINNVPENVTILIDEAYIHFVREQNYRSAIEITQEHKNVIVTRTFSKMYGMAGLRVGFAVGHQSVISELRAAGNSWGMGNINCYAAKASLEDTSFVRQVKRLTNNSKDYFYQEVKKLGLSYVPSHSSFVLVNVGQDGRALQQKLAAKNIQVRVYDNAAIKNYIRFSVGTLDEMQATVSVLKDEIKI